MQPAYLFKYAVKNIAFSMFRLTTHLEWIHSKWMMQNLLSHLQKIEALTFSAIQWFLFSKFAKQTPQKAIFHTHYYCGLSERLYWTYDIIYLPPFCMFLRLYIIKQLVFSLLFCTTLLRWAICIVLYCAKKKTLARILQKQNKNN